MDHAVLAVDELPDGRRLVVYADGREVVVGRARPRPHPVPGWEWLGRHPARPRRPRPPGPAPAITIEAQRRATDLLESLLDDGQRSDFRRTGGFWVPTPRGPVRLGRLYALVHHPHDQPGVERVLCVVPRDHGALPRADVWTNLLLMLAVEPDEFFRVANLVEVRRRPDASRRTSPRWA